MNVGTFFVRNTFWANYVTSDHLPLYALRALMAELVGPQKVASRKENQGLHFFHYGEETVVGGFFVIVQVSSVRA